MGDQPERIESKTKLCSELEWICKRCEENNPFDRTSCEKCYRRNVAHERLHMSLQKNTKAGNWHCKTCTFINEEQFLNCEFCISPKFEDKHSASSNGEGLIRGKDFNDNETDADDILRGQIKGLLPPHDQDRKISGEEKQAYITATFFNFLRNGYVEPSDEDEVDQETSVKRGSRPKTGIRNTRLYQIIFGKKTSKNDQLRTAALSGEQWSQGEKKTIDYKKEKWEGPGKLNFFRNREVVETKKKEVSWETKKDEEGTEEAKAEEIDLAKAETIILHEAKVKRFDEDTSMLAAMECQTWNCEICFCINHLSLDKCPVCENGCPRDSLFIAKLIKRRRLKKTKSLEIEHLQRQDEIEACRRFNDIKIICEKEKSSFVDDEFLPVVNSLYFEPREESVNPKWVRCHDIHYTSVERKDELSIFRIPCGADDIEPGCLDNGWFLSALGVLVESNAFLLQKIILTEEVSMLGVYVLRLCKDGRWKIVIIDDFFPCDEKKRLLYSKNKGKQLWVTLIEKAVAKLYGCYEALNSGTCGEALTLLTGEPCVIINIRDDDDDRVMRSEKVWEIMRKAMTSSFLMAASTASTTTDRYGLRPNHSYSVFGVYSVEGHQLVKLRDPQRISSWKGKWSDKSADWENLSPSAKSELRLDRNKEKGMFWMCMWDFLTYFDSIEICKLREKWRELRIKGSFPPHADQPWKFVTIYIEDNTVLDMNLFQKNKRGTGSENEPFVDMLIVILRNKTGEEGFTGVVKYSRRNSGNFVGCEVNLKPGSYTVACLAFKNWQTGVPTSYLFDTETIEQLNKDFALVIHSSGPVTSDEFDTASPKFHYILADIMIHLAINSGKRKSLDRDGFVLYTLWWYGAILVVENHSADMYGKIKCDCSGSCYLVSTRGSFITMDCVPPKHRQVIMLLTPLFPQRGWSVFRKLSHSMDKKIGFSEEWGATPRVQHVPEIQPKIAGLHSPRPT